MARPNPQITARMRARGYIPIGAAAKTYGQPRTTVSGWVKSGRIKGLKVGCFMFVERKGMRDALRPRKVTGRAGLSHAERGTPKHCLVGRGSATQTKARS